MYLQVFQLLWQRATDPLETDAFCLSSFSFYGHWKYNTPSYRGNDLKELPLMHSLQRGM